MAYDGKRLRTLRFLDQLSKRKLPGLAKPDLITLYAGKLFTCNGRIYATNGYTLASVEYSEDAHISDYVMSMVDRFEDDNGYLLKELELRETPQTRCMGIDTFERMFNNSKRLDYDAGNTYNPHLVSQALKPFAINGISPNFYHLKNMLELAGHDKNVSIRMLVMGER